MERDWSRGIPLLGHKNLLLFGLIKPPKKTSPNVAKFNDSQRARGGGAERERNEVKGVSKG